MCMLRCCSCVQIFADPWTSLPGSSVHGILQASILEWVAMLFSRGSFQPRDRTVSSCGSCIAGRLLLSHQGRSHDKEPACNAGDQGLILGLGRSPGEGHGNPLQDSCLENSHGQKSLVGYSPWGRKGQTRLGD